MPRASVAIPPRLRQSSEEGLRFILDDVATRYAAALLSDSEARAYLASRGLDKPELITGFQAGLLRRNTLPIH